VNSDPFVVFLIVGLLAGAALLGLVFAVVTRVPTISDDFEGTPKTEPRLPARRAPWSTGPAAPDPPWRG
jgi:hypothetical protein